MSSSSKTRPREVEDPATEGEPTAKRIRINDTEDANGDVGLSPGNGDVLVLAPALAQGDVEDCLPPKTRGPVTDANGELVAA